MRPRLASLALLLCCGFTIPADPGASGEEPEVGSWLDLGRHPERFALWQADAQVVPGDGPALGRFRFPAAGPELLVATPARPRLVVAPRAPGWLEVHVDGRMAYAAYAAGGPVRVDLPVRAGVHRLAFFGSLPAWAKIAPSGSPAFDDPPPEVSGVGARLTGGYRLESTGELPAAGTWVAHVQGRDAVVEAQVRCAGALAKKRHRLLFSSRLRVPLGGCAGHEGTLSLSVVSGEVTVSELRVVVPTVRVTPTPRPRGVILWVIDTLRADRMPGARGDRRGQVPGAAALADEATVYSRAYAASNWTKPSTATVLTGWMPWSHGANTHEAVLSDQIPLLPERLPARVRSAAFVANGYVSERFGFDRGWTEFHPSGRTGRGLASQITTDAIDWLDHLDRDTPFFLYLHTTEPHYPYRPPPWALERTLGADADPVDVSDTLLLRRIERGEVELDPRQRRGLVAQYDAEVVGHDLAVGRFVEGLRARGLLDDALFVLTADHGEELFDHGSVNHGGERLHEELVHIPLLVRWPGRPGLVDARPVGHRDVHATVLASLLGAVPVGVHGHPLDAADDAPPYAVSARARSRFCVVAHGHKLEVVVRGDGVEGHLFDLLSDAGETHDRVASELPMAAELTALLSLRLDEAEVPVARVPNAQVDGVVLEQLRSLGYVE